MCPIENWHDVALLPNTLRPFYVLLQQIPKRVYYTTTKDSFLRELMDATLPTNLKGTYLSRELTCVVVRHFGKSEQTDKFRTSINLFRS